MPVFLDVAVSNTFIDNVVKSVLQKILTDLNSFLTPLQFKLL